LKPCNGERDNHALRPICSTLYSHSVAYINHSSSQRHDLRMGKPSRLVLHIVSIYACLVQ